MNQGMRCLILAASGLLAGVAVARAQHAHDHEHDHASPAPATTPSPSAPAPPSPSPSPSPSPPPPQPQPPPSPPQPQPPPSPQQPQPPPSPPPPPPAPPPTDATPPASAAHAHAPPAPDAPAAHDGHAAEDPLSWLDAREASGTSWQPAASPAWAWHVMKGRRTTMVHGLAFLDAVHASGPRGDDDLGLSGWAMVMQRWRLQRTRVAWRGMFSPEAASWGESGYPELFQSGEALDGRPLVDRQHPHDLFMELALLAEGSAGPRWAWHAYVAPAGEPALGPTAFPHRVSAAENPQAPLGHHQQDSTHVSFGVATFGMSTRRVRVEASIFNAREPDQERWNLDLGPLDSFSARLALALSDRWSMQVSAGRLRDPEELEPGVDATRVTASLHHARSRGDRWIATSLVVGRNDEDGEEALDSVLLETTIGRGRNAGHARLEWAERAGLPGLAHGRTASVSAVTVGYVRDLAVARSGRWGLGAQATFHAASSALDAEYGSSPWSCHVFGRWRPDRMRHGGITPSSGPIPAP